MASIPRENAKVLALVAGEADGVGQDIPCEAEEPAAERRGLRILRAPLCCI